MSAPSCSTSRQASAIALRRVGMNVRSSSRPAFWWSGEYTAALDTSTTCRTGRDARRWQTARAAATSGPVDGPAAGTAEYTIVS